MTKPMSRDEAEDIERAAQAWAAYCNDGYSSEAQDYLDFVFENRPLVDPMR